MTRLLIVEDERSLARIFTINLVACGYEVAEAGSLADARMFLHAAEHPFDLILLDINLPDGSGWDLMREARAGLTQPLPPVIVETAVRPSQQRLDELQPSALLIKPFPIRALLQLVVRVLSTTQMQSDPRSSPFDAEEAPE